ncbi:MAG: hypothetical protein JWP97_1844 [Labilithrix sp.]|nr:hypothetical protein [Labilithrix sp.]
MRGLFSFLLLALGLSASTGSTGCSGCSRSEGAGTGTAAPRPTGSASTAKTTAGPSAVIDFIGGFDACTLSHRGVLLDLGDGTMASRMAATRLKVPDVEVREHEGASWVSLHERNLELSFVSPAETPEGTGLTVEARVRGGAGKSLAVYLNGRALGSLPLAKDETKVVSLHAASGTIARGANELLVRAVGGPRTSKDSKDSKDALAEIDWIRVGASDGDAPYAAPTRGDALTTVTIGGVARRGLSLRAPGSARCPGFVPSGAVLEGQIGVSGGEADAEVRVLVDRAEPRVIGSFHLGGEGAPAWQPISLPLGDVGTLASVELVAKASSKGARVVFAEPRVVAAAAPPADKPRAARGVVVVVLGTTPVKSLSIYGGNTPMTELAALAASGTTFDAHRATTSYASGAVASMLTGLLPRAHGVSEPEAQLGSAGITIAEAARQAGVATAMFTANPTTTAPYGFARGWATFAARPPNDEAPATAIFEDVEKWIDEHKDERFLVLVHARGGHPPWDVGSDETKDLPPASYAGSLDPKHAGEMLAKVRKNGNARLFTDADRERAFALHERAVLAHDAALGRLVAHVKQLGRDADTTWIVTGDVGIDAAAHAPFLEDDTLDEASLAVPLVVRGLDKPPRAHVASPTASVDVARTALEALGLDPPPQLRGDSLWAIMQRGTGSPERPRIATTTTRFSARWSGFVLAGSRDRETKLCNLSLEPDCASDVRATHPLAAELMHALVVRELTASGSTTAAEKFPAVTRVLPDAPTTAGLRAWGVVSGPAGSAGGTK